jgi:cell division transport system ATP-binding protein
MKPRVAITIGDYNGIGPEVVLKSLPAVRRYVTPVLVGPEKAWSAWARRLGLPDPAAETRAGRQAVDIIDPGPGAGLRLKPGTLDPTAARAAAAALETAVRLAEGGTVDAIVTGPLSKRGLHLAGYPVPGQTEFLQELTGAPSVAMMLVHDSFRVGLVTIHEPLRNVPGLITKRTLVSRIGVLAAALRIDWGIARPRMAVLGLNPHAGEDGDLGREERDVIGPAIEWLRKHRTDVRWPFPADARLRPRCRDVPRPGPDPPQGLRARRGSEHHRGAPGRSDLARSRDGLRHRRPGRRRRRQHGRGDQTRRAALDGAHALRRRTPMMIRFTNVTLEFDRHTVLEDVSFEVRPGEFAFLVGQTGSGKSTILRLMYMDLMPTRGVVTVGKYNSSLITRPEQAYLRRTLGIVFQDFRLLEDRDVFDNVAFTLHVTGTPAKDIKRRVLRALADVGLSHHRHKQAHELSGGEQQRLVIARALVNNPSFLLADEPTGNLDPLTSREILQLLKDINTRGTAVIMATHNYDLIRKSNERVLQVREGKVYEVERK